MQKPATFTYHVVQMTGIPSNAARSCLKAWLSMGSLMQKLRVAWAIAIPIGSAVFTMSFLIKGLTLLYLLILLQAIRYTILTAPCWSPCLITIINPLQSMHAGVKKAI